MRNAETTLTISRGSRTVLQSKALNLDDVSTSHRDEPKDGNHGAEGTPRIEPTGEPDDAKVSSPVRRGAAETGAHGNRADRPPYMNFWTGRRVATIVETLFPLSVLVANVFYSGLPWACR